MRHVVYTAITRSKDRLRDDQVADGAEFVAFIDSPQASDVWEQRPACDLFRCPNRCAKIHKVLPHLYFPGAAYSLWLDGNIALKVPVQTLIDEHLAEADVAMFGHPDRNCVYAELQASMPLLGKYDPAVMMEQVENYRAAGFPEHCGLHECGVIVRRHAAAVERFNEAWWAEICRWSQQDQLSVMPAAWRTGVKIATIPGSIMNYPQWSATRRGNAYVHYESHARG